MNNKLVYSTDKATNQMIAAQGKESKKNGNHQAPALPDDGIIRILRETKGRGGKGVSILTGLKLPESELRDLAKKLKQLCGTGGTVKDNCIEIQGDQREKLKQALEKMGHTVKLAGG